MARHWFGGTSNDMVRKWNFGSGNNLRTRVGELEAALRSLGLIT